VTVASSRRDPLVRRAVGCHAFGMFLITEADAEAIRAIFSQEGELSAAIELRRRFSWGHRQREGAGACPDHRRMEAAAVAIVLGNSAASSRLRAGRIPFAPLARGKATTNPRRTYSSGSVVNNRG
jgi:hypothetical protein